MVNYMKKPLIMVSLALFFLTACSSVMPKEVKKETVGGPSQNSTTIPEKENKPIDEVPPSINPAAPDTYQEYLKKLKDTEEAVTIEANTGTDADFANAKSNASFWYKELNDIYTILIKKLPEAQVGTLRQEERQWIKKRDKMVNDGSSYVSVTYYSIFAEETKELRL
jgi:uncharacterized protein YecT (DUF1311 family)